MIHLQENLCERVLNYYTWYSRNCSDCQHLTVRWPWKLFILSSRHLEGPTDGWLVGRFGNSFISNKLALRDGVDGVMLDSGNCSSCQVVLRTDCFVDRTFRGFNWGSTEHDLLVHHVLCSSSTRSYPFVPISYQMYVYQMVLCTVYFEMTWCTSNGDVVVIFRCCENFASGKVIYKKIFSTCKYVMVKFYREISYMQIIGNT